MNDNFEDTNIFATLNDELEKLQNFQKLRSGYMSNLAIKTSELESEKLKNAASKITSEDDLKVQHTLEQEVASILNSVTDVDNQYIAVFKLTWDKTLDNIENLKKYSALLKMNASQLKESLFAYMQTIDEHYLTDGTKSSDPCGLDFLSNSLM